jgi:hypothetical protein
VVEFFGEARLPVIQEHGVYDLTFGPVIAVPNWTPGVN